MRISYRVNSEESIRQLAVFPKRGKPATETADEYSWRLSASGLKAGDAVQYWASAIDRNILTGPGNADSPRLSLFLVTPEQVIAKLDVQLDDCAQALEELIRLQGESLCGDGRRRRF